MARNTLPVGMVFNLYEEDRLNTVRLTKLNYTAVNPKPLQRQSINLVSHVFNDKTCAAFRTKELIQKLKFSEGTVVFVSLIMEWYKMMNIKSKYACTRFNDEDCKPWTADCDYTFALS